jgi:hypothetical protein
MANERRVRVLSCWGTIAAGLGAGDTSISFTTTPANLPTIDANKYAALTLDPDTSNEEVIYVTAFTAGDTTATIVRGREGTTAVSHAVAAPWIHGPTLFDFGRSVDLPWGGDLGYDQEFDADYSTALPAGWSWINQIAGATYTEEHGAGRIDFPALANTSEVVGVFRSLPALASFTITGKLRLHVRAPANYLGPALLLRESSTGKILTWFEYLSNMQTGGNLWTNATSFNSTVIGSGTTLATAQQGIPPYWRIRKNSATSWDFLVSYDGIGWAPWFTGINVSTWLTPNQFGWGFDQFAATAQNAGAVVCEWIRVR